MHPKSRLPTIGSREQVEAAGHMAYGVNLVDLWRRAAVFVDKILKGAKPADHGPIVRERMGAVCGRLAFGEV